MASNWISTYRGNNRQKLSMGVIAGGPNTESRQHIPGAIGMHKVESLAGLRKFAQEGKKAAVKEASNAAAQTQPSNDSESALEEGQFQQRFSASTLGINLSLWAQHVLLSPFEGEDYDTVRLCMNCGDNILTSLDRN